MDFTGEAGGAVVGVGDEAAIGRPVGRELKAALGFDGFGIVFGKAADANFGCAAAERTQECDFAALGCPDGSIAKAKGRSELFRGARLGIDDPEGLGSLLNFVNRGGQLLSIRGETGGFQVDVGGADGGEAAAGAVDPDELGAGGVFQISESAVGGDGEVGG